jgi:hypothetical protein
LFAYTISPSKPLNIQGMGAVQAINALSVDPYADGNHHNTRPIGGPAGVCGSSLNRSSNWSKEMRGLVMSKALACQWLTLMLLLAGCLGGCCSPQGSTRDFWDKQESIVKPGGP